MKKAIFMIMAVLAVFGMVSCDSGGGGGNNPPPSPTFDLTFNLNGGTSAAITPVTVTKGTAIGASNFPADPTQTGSGTWVHTFDGWWTVSGASGGEEITATTVLDGSFTTVYARWASYDSSTHALLQFNLNNGGPSTLTIPVSKLYELNTAVGTLENFAAALAVGDNAQRYEFKGWSLTQSSTTADFTASSTLSASSVAYAVWGPEKVKISFSLNGAPGQVPALRWIAKGTAIGALPVDPTWDGTHLFRAWYTVSSFTGGNKVTANSSFTEDQTVYVRWYDPAKVITFNYHNGSSIEVDFEPGDSWSDVLANLTASQRKDSWTDDGKVRFAYWKDQNDSKWTSGTVNAKLTLEGVFWSTEVTDDTTADEKLLLENGGKAIYEFDLDAEDLKDYKEFQVTYKISEAILKEGQTNHRVYQYPTTEEQGTWPAAIDDPSKDPEDVLFLNNNDFNKGELMILNGGRDIPFTTNPENKTIVNNIIAVDGDDVDAGSVTIEEFAEMGDVWFTVKYVLPTYSKAEEDADKALQAPKGIKEGDTKPVAGLATTGKLYFGLGLTTNAGNRNATTAAPAIDGPHVPILQLVKDVKLVHRTETSKDVAGVKPGDALAQFMAYADPKSTVYCWRGDADTEIDLPVTLPPPPFNPQAIVDFVVYNPTLKLFQNDTGKTGFSDVERKRITISGNTITFDIREKDYNDTAAGEYGGGGFKILFEDLELPTIDGTSDYRSYKSIIVDCTISGAGMTGKQIVFCTIDNANITLVGQASAYVGMAAGAATFTVDTNDVGGASATGFAVKANNWGSGNVPIQGTITVNSVTFSTEDL